MKIIQCLVLSIGFASVGIGSISANELDKSLNVCVECHGLEGKAQVPGWPAISSMNKDTLIKKLKAYRAKLVPESRMADVAHNLTDEEIELVAHYYSMVNIDSEGSK